MSKRIIIVVGILAIAVAAWAFQSIAVRVAVEAQEGVFVGTNSLVAQISGRPSMTIEEFVAKNRAAFV